MAFSRCRLVICPAHRTFVGERVSRVRCQTRAMGLLEADAAAVRAFVHKAKANQVTPPKPVVAAALTFGLQPLHVAATMRDDGTTTEWTVVTMVDDGLVVVEASCGVSDWSWSKSQRDDKATVEATFYPFSRVSGIGARNPRVYVDGFVQSSDISWASGEWFVTIDGRDVPIPLGIDEGEAYTSHCLAFSQALREKIG